MSDLSEKLVLSPENDCFFMKFDKNGDGRITLKEVKDALIKPGSASADEVFKLMEEIDTDGDGSIERDEFAAFCSAYPPLLIEIKIALLKSDGTLQESVLPILVRYQNLQIIDLEESLTDLKRTFEDYKHASLIDERELAMLRAIVIFRNIDRNKDGVLSPLEFSSAVREADDKSEKARIVLDIMKKMDKDENGTIDEKEFLDFTNIHKNIVDLLAPKSKPALP